MQAIVFEGHGPLENVKVAEMAVPQPGPGEVLLAMKAAALNRLDLWVLEGWPSLRLSLPHIMGSDGAGEVAALGEGVTSFAVGDRVVVNPSVSCGRCSFCVSGRDNLCDYFGVVGEHTPGLFAEYQVVPARSLLKLPADASFEAAAAAALVFVTAWHSLITRGGLRAGEDVLVVGAGGGVNTAAIQIAKLAGARRIYVVGSSAEKLAQAAELGADVLINRQEEEWSKAIYRLTERQGVDIVVDNVGAATYHSSLRALKRGGRLLTVGNTSGTHVNLDNRLLFGKQLSIMGSSMGPQQDFAQVMGLVFSGRLQPVIDSIYPLSEGVEALRKLETGDVFGKLVLRP